MKTKLGMAVGLLLALGVHHIAHTTEPGRGTPLLTEVGESQLDLSLVYSNQAKTGVQTGPPVTIQIAPARFIQLPSAIVETQRTTDIGVGSMTGRYGLSRGLEVYGRLSSVIAESLRVQGLDGTTMTQSGFRVAELSLGANYQLLPERTQHPGVVIFGEGAVFENNATLSGTALSYGTAYLVGATAYRSLDPLVLALTAAGHISLTRSAQGQRQNPGNFVLVNPSVSFLVNDQVSLSAGLQWRRQDAVRLNGHAQGPALTQTDATAGLAYVWSPRVTLTLDARANLSGGGGADIGLTAIVKLGTPVPHPRP